MLYILYINQNALVVSGWWSSENPVAGKVYQENTSERCQTLNISAWENVVTKTYYDQELVSAEIFPC